jgi:hypothetical protein
VEEVEWLGGNSLLSSIFRNSDLSLFIIGSQSDYFTINRPRQYGKTTLMYHLFQAMQKKKNGNRGTWQRRFK